MAIADILSAAQGGLYYANVARAAGISETEARAAIAAYVPQIGAKLKNRAADNPVAFDALLDLLEEGGDNSNLDDVEAMTGAEALRDGTAVLEDLYGSPAKARKTLGATDEGKAKAAAISAVAVLAVLSAGNAQKLTGVAAHAADTGKSAGKGIIAIIIAALLKGLLQGARQRLAPKRRRRRYTYSTRRRTTTRRRARKPGLEDIFKDILIGRR